MTLRNPNNHCSIGYQPSTTWLTLPRWLFMQAIVGHAACGPLAQPEAWPGPVAPCPCQLSPIHEAVLGLPPWLAGHGHARCPPSHWAKQGRPNPRPAAPRVLGHIKGMAAAAPRNTNPPSDSIPPRAVHYLSCSSLLLVGTSRFRTVLS